MLSFSWSGWPFVRSKPAAKDVETFNPGSEPRPPKVEPYVPTGELDKSPTGPATAVMDKDLAEKAPTPPVVTPYQPTDPVPEVESAEGEQYEGFADAAADSSRQEQFEGFEDDGPVEEFEGFGKREGGEPAPPVVAPYKPKPVEYSKLEEQLRELEQGLEDIAIRTPQTFLDKIRENFMGEFTEEEKVKIDADMDEQIEEKGPVDQEKVERLLQLCEEMKGHPDIGSKLQSLLGQAELLLGRCKGEDTKKMTRVKIGWILNRNPLAVSPLPPMAQVIANNLVDAPAKMRATDAVESLTDAEDARSEISTRSDEYRNFKDNIQEILDSPTQQLDLVEMVAKTCKEVRFKGFDEEQQTAIDKAMTRVANVMERFGGSSDPGILESRKEGLKIAVEGLPKAPPKIDLDNIPSFSG